MCDLDASRLCDASMARRCIRLFAGAYLVVIGGAVLFRGVGGDAENRPMKKHTYGRIRSAVRGSVVELRGEGMD